MFTSFSQIIRFMTTHLPREMYLEIISFQAASNCFYPMKTVKSKKRSGWEMVLTFCRDFKICLMILE